MATPHSVNLEMDLIMSSPPSAPRNSTVTFVIRILTFIIGFVALVGGGRTANFKLNTKRNSEFYF